MYVLLCDNSRNDTNVLHKNIHPSPDTFHESINMQLPRSYLYSVAGPFGDELGLVMFIGPVS
jgi:hypothetical protein